MPPAHPSTASRIESPGAVTTIGKGIRVRGQIFSKEDLYVDGDVEGTIELHDNKLTIGPNGKVHAGVKARDVVVLGTIHGNVAGDRVEIRKEGRLVGDIRTERIVIEDGAYFKGSIDIVRADAARPAQAGQKRPESIIVDIDSPAAQKLDAAAEADIRAGRFDSSDAKLEEHLRELSTAKAKRLSFSR